MILLPNLLKFYHKKKVEKYSFNEYLEEAKKEQSAAEMPPEPEKTVTAEELEAVLSEAIAAAAPDEIEEPEPEEPTEQIEPEPEPQAERESMGESLARIHAEEIVSQAREEAEQMLARARDEAERLKTQAFDSGYQEGYEKGYDEGHAKSMADVKETMDTQCRAYLEEIRETVDEVCQMKDEMLQKYKQDLKNIAVAIGEKVIQVSLKSSGSVIERMIVTATEKLKTRQWAKIYIARTDADLMVQGDLDILKSISRLSDNLKVVAMENEKPGTIIVELPDEIIDASASTQVENIKEILNNSGM